ncbi:coiled-coil domain-containing protein 158-like isoform X2 [Polypterus senegalus]|uniref:coiled-coil domain-containing protein 158-like isoform X2 n=1 Tax=Polypterus senegalus TaxID=55291 RepID=UPI00196326A1|nr:coiled-coil domain-containing protein 158-like isoform X2 [Polypterus senegalus]
MERRFEDLSSSCQSRSLSGSSNFSELRERMAKQTKETKRQQEEVEQATKLTMEKIGRSFTGSLAHKHLPDFSHTTGFLGSDTVKPGLNCQNDLSSGSYCKRSFTSHNKRDTEEFQNSGFGLENDHQEKTLQDYRMQVKMLEKMLGETYRLSEQQRLDFDKTCTELQVKLQEVQMERDTLAEKRYKERQDQEDLINQMQATVNELEKIKKTHNEQMKEALSRSEALLKKQNLQDKVLHKLRAIILDYGKRSGKKITSPDRGDSLSFSNLGTAMERLLSDLDAEISQLQGKIQPMEDLLESFKQESQRKLESLIKQHQEQMENLIVCHNQKVAELNEKISLSRNQAQNIQSQVETVQEQARNQNAIHINQLSDLETSVAQLKSELHEAKRIYKEHIESLEKSLSQARSESEFAKKESGQRRQEFRILETQYQQIMADLQNVKDELIMEKEQNKELRESDATNTITIANLKKELEEQSKQSHHLDDLVNTLKDNCQAYVEHQLVAGKREKDALDKILSLENQLDVVMDELKSFKDIQKNVAHLHTCLEEKEKDFQELATEKQNIYQLLEAKNQELCTKEAELGQHISEENAAKLKLAENEQKIKILQQQVENVALIAGQHSRNFEATQNEKMQLLKDIGEIKQEVQHLKITKKNLNDRLKEIESVKTDLMESNSEKTNIIKELTLEKNQLETKLEAQQNQMAKITEEMEDMKKKHFSKCEEMEKLEAKLNSQLTITKDELEQTRNTLKSLQRADGHAIKVAMGMQRQITSKRGKIDALQSRVNFLEESVKSYSSEKKYLKEENIRLCEELATVVAERATLTKEISNLHNLEGDLTEKTGKLETALKKTSGQLAECQRVIQQQEQELVYLKLQNALDARELHGPAYSLAEQPPRPQLYPVSNYNSSNIQKAAIHLFALKPEIQQEDNKKRSSEQQLGNQKNLYISANSIPTTDVNDFQKMAEKPCVLQNIGTDISVGRNSMQRIETFNTRDISTLHTRDLEDEPINPSHTNREFEYSFLSATPRYASSPRKLTIPPKSPVHSLLVSAPESDSQLAEKAEKISCVQNKDENAGPTCRKLQGRLYSLQNLIADLQIKNQEATSMIQTQEKRIKKVKVQKKLLNT